MDWGRAKTILILAFLLLNVVLGVQLSSSRSDLLELESNPSGIAAEELQQALKLKNIQIPADFPKEAPKLREIIAHFDEKLTPGRPVELPVPFKFDLLMSRTAVKEVLGRTGIAHIDAYQLDPTSSTEQSFVLHQLYGALPMFEVQLELIEQDGFIKSYKQGYVTVQSEGSAQKEQKVISPYTALRSLVENHLSPGSVITAVKLGYHGQVYDSETIYMAPSWRVSLSNGDSYFIHAFTGGIEPVRKK